MSGVLAKLFTDNTATTDFLVKAVNGLASNGDQDEAAQKVVKLARSHRETLEKRANDLEVMFLELNQQIGTPMVVAGLRAMFEVSSLQKGTEASADRAVELMKHYVEEGKLNTQHLAMCADIFVPLARNMVFYCLQRKNMPEIAMQLARLCLSALPSPGVVSSLHCAFLASCVKTDNFDEALTVIYPNIVGLLNEAPPSANKNSSGPDGPPPSSSCFMDPGSMMGMGIGGRRNRGPVAPPFFESVYLLQYFYYSALVLLKKGDRRRALLQLELCICYPGNAASLVQLDALKKFYIVSLMEHDHITLPGGKTWSAPLNRAWRFKGRSDAYNGIVSAVLEHPDRASMVGKQLDMHRETFQKDDNTGLVEMLIETLRVKAVFNISKSFSSILLKSMAARAYVSEEVLIGILNDLGQSGKLVSSLDQATGVVSLSLPKVEVDRGLIEQRGERLEFLRSEVDRLDVAAQLHPTILHRSLKTSAGGNLFDDEGLSMGSGPLEI